MFWVNLYFMLKIMIPVVVVCLIIISGIYRLWHRDYRELKTDVPELKGLWYVEYDRCGACVTVVVYGPGFPRRKAMCKPILLGTLASPSKLIEHKNDLGEIEWI